MQSQDLRELIGVLRDGKVAQFSGLGVNITFASDAYLDLREVVIAPSPPTDEEHGHERFDPMAFASSE